MGGLTVLKSLRRELPEERFIYLGDTARLPYGTKSATTVRRYAEQAASQLVDRGVKALVIACNTASAFALQHLTEKFSPLPVYGVVQPGAEAAARVADNSGVLVLATESTINGGAYQRALTEADSALKIYARPCPLWVTLAEQGPLDAAVTRHLLEHYLRGFTGCPSTVLLGCTHFPVFKSAIQTITRSTIVDSADTTALSVKSSLAELELLGSDSATVEFYATDGVARFRQVGAHFLGEPIDEVALVDL